MSFGQEKIKRPPVSADEVSRLRRLAAESELRWDLLVLVCSIDARYHEVAMGARNLARAAWVSALVALESGSRDWACAWVRRAHQLMASWGDDSIEAQALELLSEPPHVSFC